MCCSIEASADFFRLALSLAQVMSFAFFHFCYSCSLVQNVQVELGEMIREKNALLSMGCDQGMASSFLGDNFLIIVSFLKAIRSMGSINIVLVFKLVLTLNINSRC